MKHDDSTESEEGLAKEAREAIARTCERHGFPLAGAKLEGEILQLTPRTLEELPDGEALEAVAGELEDGDYRYVTFAVPHSELDGGPT